jgi:hypothetical protein
MAYITTEYEAEVGAGRRRAILTFRNGQGATTVMPVTLLSYDWGRTVPGAAALMFGSDGASMMHYRYTGEAAPLDRDIPGDKEA